MQSKNKSPVLALHQPFHSWDRAEVRIVLKQVMAAFASPLHALGKNTQYSWEQETKSFQNE